MKIYAMMQFVRKTLIDCCTDHIFHDLGIFRFLSRINGIDERRTWARIFILTASQATNSRGIIITTCYSVWPAYHKSVHVSHIRIFLAVGKSTISSVQAGQVGCMVLLSTVKNSGTRRLINMFSQTFSSSATREIMYGVLNFQ